MVRYFGLYANAHRGKVRKSEKVLHKLGSIEEEWPRIPRRGWAEMIRKVYQINPLLCPQCGGRMTIISFIKDHKIINNIIVHLKLTFHAERPPPPQIVQKELLVAAEEMGKYF